MGKICEICGQQTAKYVCSDCGKSVCENCFIPERWLCIECYRKRTEAPRPIQLHNTVPYKLFLAGFILTAIGSILIAFAPLFGASFQGGGFVWIFPFPPFFFGSKLNGEIAVSALILLIAILLLAIVTILLFHKHQFNHEFSASFPFSL